jgi:hypothetical protein
MCVQRNCYVALVGIWALLCLGHSLIRTLIILSGPHDSDLYAYSWSYQGVIFLIFFLPAWIVGLSVVVSLLALYFVRTKK